MNKLKAFVSLVNLEDTCDVSSDGCVSDPFELLLFLLTDSHNNDFIRLVQHPAAHCLVHRLLIGVDGGNDEGHILRLELVSEPERGLWSVR